MRAIVKRKFIYWITVVFFFGLGIAPEIAQAKKKKARGFSAKSAILVDVSKGKRIYGKNVHKRVLPASTAKVMTALIVLEKLSLDKVVTVSRRASRAQPTKIFAKEGEKFKVRDLLHAILIKSANDAAIALAEAVAGSEWKFVQLMNKRAKQLGAKNTRFANASGLPTKKTKQYTSAYDMYLIMRKALRYSFFKKTIVKKYATITSRSGRKIKLKSHNKILFKKWKQNIHGKTGWTRAAGACFAGYYYRRKKLWIIAVFGCSRRWEDIKHIIRKYGKLAL